MLKAFNIILVNFDVNIVVWESTGNNINKYFDNINKINFKFVNYVFRYNKFKPGDKKFIAHYDTPYYDAKNKYCSKYTIIIYLTKGNANPALQIHNVHINKIDEFTCIIFNQKYEHEGIAFIDTDKIFLRSELIFYDYDYQYDDNIAKIFNKACYLTKQSMFNSEIKEYTNKLFNQSNTN